MNCERLLRLAECLEYEVPEERFDIGIWGHGEGCGFAGCAIGFGIELIPEFKQAGFILVEGQTHLAKYLEPSYQGKSGLRAVASFFDIAQSEAYKLFTNYDDIDNVVYISPKGVAQRIKEFVK